MKFLVLGGTKFLGRHFVQTALATGHEVTLFNRNKHAPLLYAGESRIHKLTGDRQSDLSALRTGEWDCVIDLSGYDPKDVHSTCDLLAGRVKRYVFVSSISVYSFDVEAPIDESSFAERTGETYGPLKARCEDAVFEKFGTNAGVVVRPGLIVGPHDPTFRFNYWLARIARGGAILAPGQPERNIQIIDARDLALFMLRLAQDDNDSNAIGDDANSNAAGIFNASGYVGLKIGDLFNTISHVVEQRTGKQREAGAGPELIWVSDRELLERSVEEWTELPLWIAEEGESANFYKVDCSKAVAKGLTNRPIDNTVEAIFSEHPELLDPGYDHSSGANPMGFKPTMSASLESAILEEISAKAN